MELSNYEKQVLDQIEESLSGEAPRLASSLRNPRAFHRVRRGVLGVGGWIGGILLAVLGVHANNTVGIVVGVFGFGLIVATTFVLWSSITLVRRRRPNSSA